MLVPVPVMRRGMVSRPGDAGYTHSPEIVIRSTGTSGLDIPTSAGRFGFSLPHRARPAVMLVVMPRSILVVDDDSTFRGLARRILTALGLAVVGEADTAKAAIEAAAALRPDAVL